MESYVRLAEGVLAVYTGPATAELARWVLVYECQRYRILFSDYFVVVGIMCSSWSRLTFCNCNWGVF